MSIQKHIEILPSRKEAEQYLIARRIPPNILIDALDDMAQVWILSEAEAMKIHDRCLDTAQRFFDASLVAKKRREDTSSYTNAEHKGRIFDDLVDV